MTLIQNKIMRLQNAGGISIIYAFTAVFRIIRDLRCQERLWILCFSAFFAFSPLNFNEPPKKWKPVVCDLWLVDFDPFVCFCVSRFVALFLKSTVSFTLILSFFYFFILKRGKFNLDFKGEIVPIELPNSEETQIRKGENKLVCSWQTHWMLR